MNYRLLTLVCLLFGACSSVSIVEQRENTALAPTTLPKVLWVRPFDVPLGADFDVAGKSGDKNPKATVGHLVAKGIMSRTDRWGLPGKLLENGAPTPSGGLLVRGKVLRALQGSRALRLGIGFGIGRSRMGSSVKVFNLERSTTTPWLTFETTGGSNSEPGLVGMLVPSPVSIPVAVSIAGGAVAAGGITGKGVTEDANRTGRTIAAAIHEQLAAEGLLKRKATAKRPGRLRTPVGTLPFPSAE